MATNIHFGQKTGRRIKYDRDELLKMRSNPMSLIKPTGLPDMKFVKTTPDAQSLRGNAFRSSFITSKEDSMFSNDSNSKRHFSQPTSATFQGNRVSRPGGSSFNEWTKSVFTEIFVRSFEAALKEVQNSIPPMARPLLVTSLIKLLLESSSESGILWKEPVGGLTILQCSARSCSHLGKFFCLLVEQEILSLEEYFNELKAVFLSSASYQFSVLLFWEYMAELLSPAFQNDVVPLRNIAVLIALTGEKSDAFNFLLNVLNALLRDVGAPKLKNMWTKSELSVVKCRDFTIDTNVMFTESYYNFFLENGDVPPPTSSLELAAFEKELKEFLGNNRWDRDKLASWIKTRLHAYQLREPGIIGVLVYCMVLSAYQLDSHKAYVLDPSFLVHYCDTIKMYIEKEIDLELAALSAVHRFSCAPSLLKKPLNALSQVFTMLFEENVISFDAFFQWKSLQKSEPRSKDHNDCCIETLYSFFSYLSCVKYETEWLHLSREYLKSKNFSDVCFDVNKKSQEDLKGSRAEIFK